MKTLSVIAATFIVASLGTAQSFNSQELDNYAGVSSLMYNPANITDSRFRTEVNLFHLSSNVANDYYSLNFSNGLDSFNFDNDATTFPTEQNNFFLNLDVLGPAVQFNLSRKHSIALSTRIRGMYNINNVSGEFYQLVRDTDFDPGVDISARQDNLSSTGHAWGELGITYALVLLDEDEHFVKAGATVKYLVGGGAAFLNSDQLSVDYSANSREVFLDGNLEIAQSAIDNNNGSNEYDFNFDNNGLGLDLGFVYEYRPETTRNLDGDLNVVGNNKYRLRIGASLQDIGSITYNDTQFDRYVVDGRVSVIDLQNDFEQAIEDSFMGTRTTEDVAVSLPTTLRYLVDYRISKRIYLGVTGAIANTDDRELYGNRIVNYTSITPRYESKLITVSSNLSFSDLTGFNWGAGVRLGPVTLGSGTLFSNLFQQDSRGVDFYAGLKIPIYQRKNIKRG